MIVTIPVGRMARWVGDMKHGYSPLPEGQVHAFLNHAGLTKEEAKRSGGTNGDPWCVHCGRNYRKHPDIPYPVFVPPQEVLDLPEADVPLGYHRPSGSVVRWPFQVINDRGLISYLYAANEDEARELSIDFEYSFTFRPVVVRLDFPVPATNASCTCCGQVSVVTTTGLKMWGPGIAGGLETGVFRGMCGPCSVASYISERSRPDCSACEGRGWLQDPDRYQGRRRECSTCFGRGSETSGPVPDGWSVEAILERGLSAPSEAVHGDDLGHAVEASAATHEGDEFKLCPDCAESVRAAARKCRFCGFLFDV